MSTSKSNYNSNQSTTRSSTVKSYKSDKVQSTKQTEHGSDDDMAANSTKGSSNTDTREQLDIPRNSSPIPMEEDHDDRKNARAQPDEVTSQQSDYIKIVCISDTHNGHTKKGFDARIRKMQGDILIHAGDFGDHGTPEEVTDIFEWLSSLNNFKYKIFISGNMDGIGLDGNYRNSAGKQKLEELLAKDKSVKYLENDACKVLGVKIYGCPYTPKFFGGFQYARESKDAKQLWSKIPDDCDILVSHGPPFEILDQSSRGEHVGCPNLKEAIWQRRSLKAIVFGHVHHSYGIHYERKKLFVNAAQYKGIHNNDMGNEPIEIVLRRDDKSVYGIFGIH